MKAIVIALLGCGTIVLAACGGGDNSGGFVPSVDVYEVVSREVPVYSEFVGEIYGKKDIAIRARVEGYLMGIHFEEGSVVQRGKLLYAIESQPYEEQVAARMSEVAEAQTRLALAESDLGRIRPLAEQNAVSQSDLDAAVAQYKASQSGVEAARAKLSAARINLSYTRIKSPITGIIGKTKAKVGDFVGRDPNPVILNTVSQTDTILVQFFITESQYLFLARRILSDSARPYRRDSQQQGLLTLFLADGSRYPLPGRYDFIDRGVDPTTGAILVQASFPNPDGIIRSGQFARVRALAEQLPDGIIIPQRCVMELQGQYSVFVVTSENTIERRAITVGPKYHNFWIVMEGLTAGERVVYEGLQKVRPGASVRPEVKDVQLITDTEP